MCSKKCKGWLKCKKLAEKVLEECIKKAVGGLVLAIVLGFSLKLLLAVPAFSIGAAMSKVVSSKMIGGE
jgi:hypothetical protein